LLALFVVVAALIAWILGPGWWTPVIGFGLVGFGPGYLLLHGVAHSVPDALVRTALYVGTSVAMAALIGLSLSVVGLPLQYMSFASAYLVVTPFLFAVHEIETRRGDRNDEVESQHRGADPAVFVVGSLVVAVPFLACWALLAFAPVRNPPTTELYFAASGGQISDLPTTYRPPMPVVLRVIAHLGVPATSDHLEVVADGRTLDSWQLPRGATHIDRLMSVDTSDIRSNPLRVEARLFSSGGTASVVWVNLFEARSE
jgi:uncharacterized membrane protein